MYLHHDQVDWWFFDSVYYVHIGTHVLSWWRSQSSHWEAHILHYCRPWLPQSTGCRAGGSPTWLSTLGCWPELCVQLLLCHGRTSTESANIQDEKYFVRFRNFSCEKFFSTDSVTIEFTEHYILKYFLMLHFSYWS